MIYYKYNIEEFIDGKWIVNIRYYAIKNKSNKDFDTYDIPNKRRNFKKVEE